MNNMLSQYGLGLLYPSTLRFIIDINVEIIFLIAFYHFAIPKKYSITTRFFFQQK